MQYQIDAGQPEQQAQPLPWRDAFAEQRPGAERDEDRVQRDDQRRHRGRHTERDAVADASGEEADAEQAGEADVHGLAQVARPRGAHGDGDAGEDGSRQREAQAEEYEGFGVRQAETGADEAGAGEHDEEQRQQAGECGVVHSAPPWRRAACVRPS